MSHEHVTIEARDGKCPADVMTPVGKGRWPGVIFYMDAGGIRPAMIQMAQRLAERRVRRAAARPLLSLWPLRSIRA